MNLSRHACLVSAVLAACASTPPTWEKPGANAATVQEDTDQCRMQARSAPVPPRHAPAPAGMGTLTTAIVNRDQELAQHEAAEFQKCMTGKGYSAKR